MFAIVEIAGQQFKVEKDQYLYVHRLQQEVGASIELDKVLLVNNNGSISVGVLQLAEPPLKLRCLTT
jgi:large subunit ribosomal protein L21